MFVLALEELVGDVEEGFVDCDETEDGLVAVLLPVEEDEVDDVSLELHW